MKHPISTLVTMLFPFLLATVASGEDQPRVIIEKAIKAHGGEKNFQHCKAGTIKSKGKFATPGSGEASFTMEDTFQLPGQFKRVTRVEGPDHSVTMTFVINGDQGWVRRADGTVADIDTKAVSEMEQHVLLSFTRLVSLATDTGVKMTPLGETTLDGRPVLGIKVEQKTSSPVELYFDKASGLLRKSKRTQTNPLAGKEATVETVCLDFKEFNHVQLPGKVLAYRNGQRFIEWTILDVKFADKLDDKIFAKP